MTRFSQKEIRTFLLHEVQKLGLSSSQVIVFSTQKEEEQYLGYLLLGVDAKKGQSFLEEIRKKRSHFTSLLNF